MSHCLDYQSTLTALFSRLPKKCQNNLLMQELLKLYGNPHLTYPTIHVGGTNGKGQVATKIARALEYAGYRVGLYTSPHLIDYAERITINGKKIPHETVVEYDFVMRNLIKKERIDPNFFECTTCYGFRYFQEQNVDIAVIEVGLGGLYDATNVIQPLLSVITSIDFDHMEYLGRTLEDIAYQKAGIIKEHTSLVLGPTAQLLPILETAKKKYAPVHFVKGTYDFYEKENTAIAKIALSLLPFALPQKAIEKGIASTLSCRFERRGEEVFDVAHNPAGFIQLKNALTYFYPEKKFRFVIGMNQRKDFKQSLQHIENIATHIHFVQADDWQSASVHELADALQSISQTSFDCESSITSGMMHARALKKKEEILVICGSFYIMLDALNSEHFIRNGSIFCSREI